MLRPEDFFDLSEFEHRALFDNCKNVWEALTTLGPYLDSLFIAFIWRARPVASEPYVNIVGPAYVGDGTHIEGPCRIGKRVIIGRNCVIRAGANLREDVIIGNNCVVGGEVKHSIIMNNSNKGHVGALLDSIVGGGCNLAEQTGTSNVEHRGMRDEDATIWITVDGVKYDTGLRKFGAILGDGSLTASGTILSPGTILGKNSFVMKSGTVPKGYYPPDSKITPR